MEDTSEYKCPSCGASLRFDINKNSMICDFCSGEYNFAYIRSHFKEVTDKKLADFDWVERTKYVWEPDMLDQLAEYTCSSCGGNILTKNTTATAKCPFCNHEVVISSHFAGDLRPDKVIPFKIKPEEFAEKYRSSIASAVYAPKEFREASVKDNIVGCYIPIWLYSCDCDAIVNPSYKVNYEIIDFPTLGTDIKKDIFYSVAPFKYDKAEDFTESCLTGFYASRYSIGAEHAMESADREIKNVCSLRAAALVEVDFIPDVAKESCEISKRKLTYYLVPIWFMNVEYKGKEYTFAMNGQTGEFASPDIPFNYKSKLLFWSSFIILEVLAFILSYFYLKEDDSSIEINLLITTLFTLFFSTIFVFGASGIVYLIVSRKFTGGLRCEKKYSIAGISSYIDKEVKVNRINNK